jgi:hypothetical protein
LILTLFILQGKTALADWVESPDARVVHVHPADQAVSLQNPPGFSWARAQRAEGYELALIGPGDSKQVWQTSRNWFLPFSRLAAGSYSWKVRPKGPDGPWSNLRHFTIATAATVFEVPSEEKLLQFIRARSRPRSLTSVARNNTAAPGTVAKVPKDSATQALEYQVRTNANKPLVDERSVTLVPRSRDEKAWAASLAAIRSVTSTESQQLRVAALLWHTTGNRFYLEEAKRRGDALAALNPAGSTSHMQQDQGNRSVAWGLAVAYDYLSTDLPPEQAQRWLGIIRSRTAAIYSDLKSGGWRLEQMPFDSHGSTNLGYLAAISAVMIDGFPEAEGWFRDSFRAYVNYQSPWGDASGGYANGTAYAQYSVDLFVDMWDVIAAVTGVSLYEKPWSIGLLKFLACFVPPGSPAHAFGDAAETKPWITALESYANRYNDNLALWYSENLRGEEGALSSFTNPVSKVKSNAVAPVPEGNTCMFKHIGWAAMHSRWGDANRTSVYFKSSPYAAFSHSHADQNSFTLISGGEQLLIVSGYYDWYGSPHWKGWYWRTKAHNAITFDDGKGQAEKSGPEKMTATGQLVEFHSDGALDFVEGDASAAYEGELLQARRRLWYLRDENVLVIHDLLTSVSPRKFEWNIHALNSFIVKTPVSVEVKQNAARACIDMLNPSGVEFVQNNQFQPPPQNSPSRKDQWHGSFHNNERQTNVEFLAVIRVGCNAITVKSDEFASKRRVTVGGRQISIPR